MNKGLMAMVIVLLVVVGVIAALLVLRYVPVTSTVSGSQQPQEPAGSTDPQTLMIPRWFLQSMTVNGVEVALPDKHLTLQFEPDKNANGESACNGFFTTWEADYDGSLKFGDIGATKMFCDGMMETETAYFDALSQVTEFSRPEGELILSSADGQTKLVFVMPPK